MQEQPAVAQTIGPSSGARVNMFGPLLYLKKGNAVRAFELEENGQLHVPTVLAAFKLEAPLLLLNGGVPVVVREDGDGNSRMTFEPNTEADALEVDGTQGPQGGVASAGNWTPSAKLTQDLHRLGTLLKDLNVTDELLTPLSAPSTRPLIMALPSDLHVDIPPPLRASIYVRPSYWTALRKIREAVREAPEAGVVLTGSPGVGKSAFAMLLVAHLAQQGGVVIYHYTGSFCEWLVLFDFRGQQVKVEMQPYSEVRLFSWTGLPGAWLIKDGRVYKGEHEGRVPTVDLSLPTVSNWHEFEKGSRESDSLAELLECVKELGLELKPDEVVSRYIEFGGSVRLVLWSLTYTFKQLEDAFSADDDLLPLLNLQLSGLRSMASHLLMHIRADANLEFVCHQLASPKVAGMVAQTSWQYHEHEVRKRMLVATQAPGKMKSFGGMLFEQHGHQQFVSGILIRLRKLHPKRPLDIDQGDAGSEQRVTRSRSRAQQQSRGQQQGAKVAAAQGNSGQQTSGSPLTNVRDEMCADQGTVQHGEVAGGSDRPPPDQAPSSTTLAPDPEGWANRLPEADAVQLPAVQHRWDTPHLDISNMTDTYLQPPSPNNAAFDGFYTSSVADLDLMLQYTVSLSHGVRADAIAAFLARLPEPRRKRVKLVFVVPVRNYQEFTYQAWLGAKDKVLKVVPKELAGMEQWVMALPLLPSLRNRSSGR